MGWNTYEVIFAIKATNHFGIPEGFGLVARIPDTFVECLPRLAKHESYFKAKAH